MRLGYRPDRCIKLIDPRVNEHGFVACQMLVDQSVEIVVVNEEASVVLEVLTLAIADSSRDRGNRDVRYRCKEDLCPGPISERIENPLRKVNVVSLELVRARQVPRETFYRIGWDRARCRLHVLYFES